MQAGDAGTMRAITYQRYTRFLNIAKHGGKTGKGLRSTRLFPSEVSNNMRSVRPRSLLRDLGRMSRWMRVGRTNPSRRPDPRVDSLVPEGAARKSSVIGASDEGEPACLN